MPSGADVLAFYRGFIVRQKVGHHSFKSFSSLLVEFSVPFRVADFAVVEQKLDARSS